MSGGASNIHAGLVRIGETGLLILGPARSGKSALAVSLLRSAAREGMTAGLVADDRVILERREAGLFGRAPETIAGLIELSGIGILRVPAIADGRIDLVAELTDAPERLPDPATVEFLGVTLPRLLLPARQAPFAADLLLTLLTSGVDSLLDR